MDIPDFKGLYEAFNARDIDAVLGVMAPDVDWPNGYEGGRVVGHAAVRDYWIRQWRDIDPTVTPTGIGVLTDGRIALDVRQVVRNRQGAVLSDATVRHIYRLKDGLVVGMDIDIA
jgi:ketosteroid isomerase-like protein